jgi:hypothetical protein
MLFPFLFLSIALNLQVPLQSGSNVTKRPGLTLEERLRLIDGGESVNSFINPCLLEKIKQHKERWLWLIGLINKILQTDLSLQAVLQQMDPLSEDYDNTLENYLDFVELNIYECGYAKNADLIKISGLVQWWKHLSDKIFPSNNARLEKFVDLESSFNTTRLQGTQDSFGNEEKNLWYEGQATINPFLLNNEKFLTTWQEVFAKNHWLLKQDDPTKITSSFLKNKFTLLKTNTSKKNFLGQLFKIHIRNKKIFKSLTLKEFS